MGARVILALLLLVLSSCARLPQPTTSTTQSTDRHTLRRDSSGTFQSYVEKVRLTPVKLPADRVPFKTKLELNPTTGKLKPASYSSRGKRATARIDVDAEGNVSGECGCEAEEAIIAAKDRIIQLHQEREQHLADALKEKQVSTVKVPVPYTAWYDKVARVLAAVLVAGLVLLLLLYLQHRAARRSQPENDDGGTI